jgi:hypothetical protein
MTDQGPNEQKQPATSAGKKTAAAVVGLIALGAITLAVRAGGPDAPKGDAPSAIASAGSPVTSASASASSSPAPAGGHIDFSKVCRTGSGGTVPTGSASEADDYYAAMAQDIGLTQFAKLDDVLSFVGYPISATRLQDAPPAELMDPVALKVTPPPPAGAVLAARFFAPKITDVSQANTPPTQVGWRKVVRLLPTAGSLARKSGIEAAFVLFNFFAAPKAQNPFERADSVNTQVMLITSRPDLSPIYWLDYGKTSEGALLSKALDAFFDAGHPPDASGKRSYFVPCGCVACHGGLQLDQGVKPPAPAWGPEKALLNYLDTDHWFDRVQRGEDFADLTARVIFDDGGFEVIRTLNREMRDQNLRVQPGSHQERAASHWLDLHLSNAGYVDDLSKRALPGATAASTGWNGADATEMATLKRLNHYCFRCHGSVEFDVFDKAQVLSLRTVLLARLQPRGVLTDPRATMPPDRDMPDPDRVALRAFITAH